jgi:FkbM family methyltransferase
MKYARYVDSGRLTILNRGIFGRSGIHNFIVNLNRNDRSSFDSAWCPEDRKSIIEVECVTLDEVLDRFGTPYYIKIDIERLDYVCIETLERQKDLPRFISVETDRIDFIQRLANLGYQRFKIVNQLWNQMIGLPFPALEGRYVNKRFTKYHSGPFGAETYGPWLSKDEVLDEISKIDSEDFEGSRHKLLGCPEDAFLYNWYDAHAALGAC